MAKLDDLVRDVATLYRTEAEDASSTFTYEQFNLLSQVINLLKLVLETNVKPGDPESFTDDAVDELS